MNGRRSPSTSPRPRRTTSPTSLALQSSTAGWYAEWKARRQAAVPVQPAEPQQDAPGGDAEALAQWLISGNQK